jgi:hypothetical protein
MRIPRENPTGNISKNNARPAKPVDKYLARLEAECRAEELKERIKATKMMLQGITYSQMVEGPPYRVPDQVAPCAVRTALTPDAAIAILEDTVERLRLLLSQSQSQRRLRSQRQSRQSQNVIQSVIHYCFYFYSRVPARVALISDRNVFDMIYM